MLHIAGPIAHFNELYGAEYDGIVPPVCFEIMSELQQFVPSIARRVGSDLAAESPREAYLAMTILSSLAHVQRRAVDTALVKARVHIHALERFIDSRSDLFFSVCSSLVRHFLAGGLAVAREDYAEAGIGRLLGASISGEEAKQPGLRVPRVGPTVSLCSFLIRVSHESGGSLEKSLEADPAWSSFRAKTLSLFLAECESPWTKPPPPRPPRPTMGDSGDLAGFGGSGGGGGGGGAAQTLQDLIGGLSSGGIHHHLLTPTPFF